MSAVRPRVHPQQDVKTPGQVFMMPLSSLHDGEGGGTPGEPHQVRRTGPGPGPPGEGRLAPSVLQQTALLELVPSEGLLSAKQLPMPFIPPFFLNFEKFQTSTQLENGN